MWPAIPQRWYQCVNQLIKKILTIWAFWSVRGKVFSLLAGGESFRAGGRFRVGGESFRADCQTNFQTLIYTLILAVG
jgi:hypothetical protein